MITVADSRSEYKKLAKKREELRSKLKDHFCAPVEERDYGKLELIVDELDALRGRIRLLKERES